MADPITAPAVAKTGAQILGILAGLKSLAGGGSDPDPELLSLQKDIGRALLSEMQSTMAINTPFRNDLSALLRQRTGQRLPIKRASIPTGTNRFNPLASATRRGFAGINPNAGSNAIINSAIAVPEGGFLSKAAARPTPNPTRIPPTYIKAG